MDLVDSVAIFLAGGGGDHETGYAIVDGFAEGGCKVEFVGLSEGLEDTIVINFACMHYKADI